MAWCTKKSPGPIFKNKSFFVSLTAFNQPGNQIWLPATVAGFVLDDNKTLNW